MLNAHPAAAPQSRLEEKGRLYLAPEKGKLIFEMVGRCALELLLQEKTKLYTSCTHIGQVFPQHRLRIHAVCRERKAIRRPQSDAKIANSDLQLQFIFHFHIWFYVQTRRKVRRIRRDEATHESRARGHSSLGTVSSIFRVGTIEDLYSKGCKHGHK